MIIFSVIGMLAVAFLLMLYGAYKGLEIAVDETKDKGFFRVYGKKYKAVEIKDNG